MLWGHLDSTGAPRANWDFIAFFFKCSWSLSSLVWLVASRILFWVSGEKWQEPKPLPGRRSVHLCRFFVSYFFCAQLQLWAVHTENRIGTLSIAHYRCHQPALSTHSPSACLINFSKQLFLCIALLRVIIFLEFPCFLPTRHNISINNNKNNQQQQTNKQKTFLNLYVLILLFFILLGTF